MSFEHCHPYEETIEQQFMRIAKLFQESSATQKMHETTDISKKEQLILYALGHQAEYGDATPPRPPITQYEEQMKWDEWHAQKGMPKEEAIQKFLMHAYPILYDRDVNTDDPNKEAGEKAYHDCMNPKSPEEEPTDEPVDPAPKEPEKPVEPTPEPVDPQPDIKPDEPQEPETPTEPVDPVQPDPVDPEPPVEPVTPDPKPDPVTPTEPSINPP